MKKHSKKTLQTFLVVFFFVFFCSASAFAIDWGQAPVTKAPAQQQQPGSVQQPSSGSPLVDCDLTLKTTSQSFPADIIKNGSGSISVSQPKGCNITWTASSDSPSWLSVPAGPYGPDANGNAQVGYEVSQNEGLQRGGIIKLKYTKPISEPQGRPHSGKGIAATKTFYVHQDHGLHAQK